MFDMLVNMFRRRKKHSATNASGEQKGRKHEHYTHFSGELRNLRNSINESNVREKSREFYSLVKSAFREALDLKYEATFQEIQHEINAKRHYTESVRNELDSFLEELAFMEYGYEEFKELLSQKRHEQESKLKAYITELEKEGSHIKRDTKKKINDIVSESVPHTDKEFLVRIIDKFEYFLRHLF